MTSKQHIEKILEENKRLFTEFETKRNLTERWNLENSRAKDYHGRELLELLQNVDDAYEELCQSNSEMRGKEVEAFVEYTGNILRVQNNGTVFNEDSINRLCQGGVSGKKKYYIGNKGIGFRSILNWASEIRLYSGDYAVRFSENFAQKQLDEIRTKSEHVRQELSEEPNLRFPILYAPEAIPQKKYKFDTTIEIIVKPETLDDDWGIAEQIAEFDPYILLFLPNITKITFKTDENQFSFTKTLRKKNEMTESVVQKFIGTNNTAKSEEGFFVFNNDSNPNEIKDTDGKTEIVKLAVAIPASIDEEYEYKMYTFFPVRNARSPFSALLHATFMLSQNRDAILNNKVNQIVFDFLLQFYVSVISEHFCKKEFGLKALKLLCPTKFEKTRWNGDRIKAFDTPFDKDEILQKYLDLCRKQKVFFTVNDTFISLEDNPKLLDLGFPKQFKGKPFENLLADGITGEKIKYYWNAHTGFRGFVEELLGDCEYPFESLCESVNSLSEKWSSQSRCEVFAWWISKYKTEKDLPHLLKDTQKRWIIGESIVFFFDEKAAVPEWADCVVLSKIDEKNLISYYKTNYEENFDEAKGSNDCEKLKTLLGKDCKVLEFSDYNALSLMPTLNKSVGNDYNCSMEFVHWLKKNYNALKSAKPSKLLLPSSENTVLEAEKLYFGSEWENELGSNFFAESDSFKPLCIPSGFNVDKNNLMEWKEFFEWCGVLTFPKMKDEKLTKDSALYKEFTCSVDNYGEYGFQVYRTYFGGRTNDLLSVKNIANIEKILDTVSSKAIFTWILQNEDLKNEILTESHSAKCWNGYHNDYPCYLNFVFKHKKWLEIDGKRYAPFEVLVSEDSQFEPYIPCISKKKLSEMGFSADEVPEIKSFLAQLGSAESVTKLSSDTFYAFLTKLGETEDTQELSKQVYRECLEKQKKVSEWNNARSGFIMRGKLWTKNAGLQPVSKVHFSRDAVLNLSEKPILDVPFNIGSAEQAKNIFGVQEYKENIVVKSYEISSCNTNFQHYFRAFLPYAFAYAQSKIKEEVAKGLKLELCQSIEIVDSISEDKGSEEITKMYSLAQNSNDSEEWLLYVGDIESFENIARFEVAKQIESLFAKLGITDKNILSNISICFLHNDEQERQHYIEKITSINELVKWQKTLCITEEKSFENPMLHEVAEWRKISSPIDFSESINLINPQSLQFDYEREYESDEKQGDRAEQLVVEKLRNREFSEINDYFDGADYKVNWVSSASKRFENNLNFDEKLGYDVELVSDDGRRLFIEIKSYYKSEVLFYLSTKELECARSYKDAYRVIFVGDRKSSNPQITVLPCGFWKKAKTGGNDIFSFEISQYKVQKIAGD